MWLTFLVAGCFGVFLGGKFMEIPIFAVTLPGCSGSLGEDLWHFQSWDTGESD